MKDFVEHLNEGYEPLHEKIIAFNTSVGDSEIDIALQWKQDDEVVIKSFANNIDTIEGGTHEQGMRTSITAAVNSFAKARNDIHQNLNKLKWDKGFYRRDIAFKVIS